MYTIPSCKILATNWKPRTRFTVRRWWLLEIEKSHTREDYFLLTSKRLPDITDHSDNWDALFSSEKPHGYEFKLTCTVFPPEVTSTYSEQSDFAAAQGECIATFLLLPSSQYDPTVCIIFTNQTSILRNCRIGLLPDAHYSNCSWCYCVLQTTKFSSFTVFSTCS